LNQATGPRRIRISSETQKSELKTTLKRVKTSLKQLKKKYRNSEYHIAKRIKNTAQQRE
jgi:hypothetical protein